MLPELDGLEVAPRKFERQIIHQLSCFQLRIASLDKVIGLEIGADDYVIKPFF